MLDVAFSGRLDGYALVAASGGVRLAATANGGSRWSIVGVRLPATNPPPSKLVDTGSGALVAFAANGLGSQLLSSRDGGASWRTTTFPGTVRDVAVAGAQLWALVDGAPPTASTAVHAPLGPPSAWIEKSSDGGARWTLLARLPRDVGPDALLVRPSATVAYVLSPGLRNTFAARYGDLVRTTDGGARWQVLDEPCNFNAGPRFGDQAEFGVAGTAVLWVVCGTFFEPPLGPGNITQVQRSLDGGTSWALRAGTRWIEPYDHPNFPGSAAVPPASAASTAVFGLDSAWLVLTRPATLVHTDDAGESWHHDAPAALESEGPLEVVDAGGTIVVRTARSLWRLGAAGWKQI